MSCSLPDDLPWSALLEARALLADGPTGLAFVQRDRWRCEPAAEASLTDANGALLVNTGPEHVARLATGNCPLWQFACNPRGLPQITASADTALPPSIATAARVYLPVLLGAAHAKQAGRSFVAGHLTQTLDGRIACENGQSQWIGNDADLRHAHRMRALLDGVMVGANTALHDNPQLTVRHVEGTNPRRVVISGRGRFLDFDNALHLMQEPGCDVLTQPQPKRAPTSARDHVHVHEIEASNGKLPAGAMLDALRERGIHSLYLEGGSGTLSSFLQADCIDLLQVHIASLVLGSGLPGLQLPPVDHVDKGLKLQMDHALLDGHVLLTCVPEA